MKTALCAIRCFVNLAKHNRKKNAKFLGSEDVEVNLQEISVKMHQKSFLLAFSHSLLGKFFDFHFLKTLT